MTAGLARLLVRSAAGLVPRKLRARWRDEWLAELDARPRQALTRAVGAPRDAILTRWTMRSRSEWARTGWRADARDAWRAISRTPLQSMTIVVCLALGSTLTVVMFGVMNALLGGRLPGVEDQRQLVRVLLERPLPFDPPSAAGIRWGSRHVTQREWERAPASLDGFQAFGAEGQWRIPAVVGEEAVSAEGRFVSSGYFTTLGTRPVLGRLLDDRDDWLGAPPAAVISHAFWLRHFGGGPDALGAVLTIGDVPFPVVGVLPAGLVGLDIGDLDQTTADRAAIWLPFSQTWIKSSSQAAQDTQSSIRIVGRLAPGLDLEQAEAGIQRVASLMAGDGEPARMRLRPFQLVWIPELRDQMTFLAFMMGAPILVLGIACANVAGIQLARASGRTHELAIRGSLGASRGRIVRLLVLETGCLAVLACTIALLAATAALRFADLVLPFPVLVDGRVLAFAAGLPIVVTLATGFAPAWRATGFDVQSGLRLGPRVGRAASPRLRRAVVLVQVTLSVFLLMAAAHLARLVLALPASIGAPHEDVVAADVTFLEADVPAATEWQRRRSVLEQIEALPGVSSAALLGQSGLLGSSAEFSCVSGPGVLPGPAAPAVAVTPGYFQVLHLRTRSGRLFSHEDREGVVVNEAFVKRLRQDVNPLATTVTVEHAASGTSSIRPIVGVVEDSYERAPRGLARPRCYLLMEAAGEGGFTILAQSPGAALVPAIGRLLYGMRPQPHVSEVATVADILWSRYRSLYLIAAGLTLAGAVALLLTAIGLFAVLSYVVSLRTGEFGVRLALGARPGSLVRRVVRESLVLVGAGTAIGLILAIPMTQLITSELLTTVTPSWQDPVPPAIVCGMLLLTGGLASLVPGWRVARVDPVAALRQE